MVFTSSSNAVHIYVANMTSAREFLVKYEGNDNTSVTSGQRIFTNGRTAGGAPKLPFHERDSGPNLIHGSLGSPESTYQTAIISIGSAVSVAHTVMSNTQTDRETGRHTDRPPDHATSVTIGRFFALYARDAT